MGRSIGAFFAGILVNFLALGVDQILHMTGFYAPWGEPLEDGMQSIVAFSYRLILAIASGYACARLAPRNPMKHAMVLGAVGTLMSLGGAMANLQNPMGPNWYVFALAAIALPSCWLGANLAAPRSPKS
jgi:hypothetical protein